MGFKKSFIKNCVFQAIDGLLKLQDLLVSSFDNPQQEEGVWDALLVVRKKVNDYKVALTVGISKVHSIPMIMPSSDKQK